MRSIIVAGATAATLLFTVSAADAQSPSARQTLQYIHSKLSHMNVHYYSDAEAGLPKTGRRVAVVSVKVSNTGRLELVTETSSAPDYHPPNRYRVVMCLSDLATVEVDRSSEPDGGFSSSKQPFEFWLLCKKRDAKHRNRCVESHWVVEKSGKSVRMFWGHRIRVSRKDERQGPKLMRAFNHLRQLYAGKRCRRDKEPF